MIRRILMLLGVWFLCGYVMSIFFIETLNQIQLGGVPFGFWMAQQGSIYVFVALIFIYAYFSDKLDQAAKVDETDDATSSAGAAH